MTETGVAIVYRAEPGEGKKGQNKDGRLSRDKEFGLHLQGSEKLLQSF